MSGPDRWELRAAYSRCLRIVFQSRSGSGRDFMYRTPGGLSRAVAIGAARLFHQTTEYAEWARSLRQMDEAVPA